MPYSFEKNERGSKTDTVYIQNPFSLFKKLMIIFLLKTLKSFHWKVDVGTGNNLIHLAYVFSFFLNFLAKILNKHISFQTSHILIFL